MSNPRRGRCKGVFGCHWARIRAAGVLTIDGHAALCPRCERKERDMQRAARGVRAKRRGAAA